MGRVTRDALARLAMAGCSCCSPCCWRGWGAFRAGRPVPAADRPVALRDPGHGMRRLLAWAALTGAAALVQAYLLPMVGRAVGADWLMRLDDPARRGRLLAARRWRAGRRAVAGLWLGGSSCLSDGLGGTWGGYGRMQLDLLAPFDPGYGAGCCRTSARRNTWRPAIPTPASGAAGDAARRPRLARGARQGAWRRYRARCCWCWRGCCCSPSRIAWRSGREFEILPLPEQVVARWMRCGPRTLLLAGGLCALLAAGAALVARLGGGGRLVLAAALLVQAVDLRPASRAASLLRGAAAHPAAAAGRPLLARGGRHYAAVRVVPTGMQAPNWEEVAVYAATLGLRRMRSIGARLALGRHGGERAGCARLETGEHERGPSTCSATRRRWRAPGRGWTRRATCSRGSTGGGCWHPGWLAREAGEGLR